jgi:hypothetical protein
MVERWSLDSLLSAQRVEKWWFHSQHGQDKKVLSSSKPPDRLWGPIQIPNEGLAVSVSPGIKRLKQESDHSLHFLPRLRMNGAIPPPDTCRHGFQGDSIYDISNLRVNKTDVPEIDCEKSIRLKSSKLRSTVGPAQDIWVPRAQKDCSAL